MSDGAPELTPEQYAAFAERVEQAALETLGLRLVKWVMPVVALDDDMESIEDTLLPQEQLLIDTAGLLRFAVVNCDYHLVQANHRD